MSLNAVLTSWTSPGVARSLSLLAPCGLPKLVSFANVQMGDLGCGGAARTRPKISGVSSHKRPGHGLILRQASGIICVGFPARHDQAVLQPAREQGISADMRDSSR